MRAYSLSHLSEETLGRNLPAAASEEHGGSAWALAHLAEFDARRLFVPAGYASMRAYSVQELGYSDDAALKRIRAGRAARQFPAIFPALAEGRLHLTAVRLLAPHLTPENATELLAAAEHKTNSEIEQLIARRFPRSEMLPLVEPHRRRRWSRDPSATPTASGDSPTNWSRDQSRPRGHRR